ncbi:MAG: hypothetical protein U5L96_08255 [Owenweeksia sp.]|nr:hypothetical protein [Owenweeksia sp.]
MNCVADEYAGIASGINNTVSRLAGVLALAIIGAFALLSFQKQLGEQLANAKLSETQLQYMKQEATRLAEALPKEEWAATTKKMVKREVKLSFVRVFHLAAYATASLCLLGALLAWWFIKGKPKKSTCK